MEKRLAMLNMFSTTFLRRNKEDIRHDIPEKSAIPGQIDADAQSWGDYQRQLQEEEKAQNAAGNRGKPWFQSLLEEMGRQKIPHTVAAAVEHLKSNAQFKVFVVTAHPEFADVIAQKINEILGDGIAASVHGDTDKDARQTVPSTFKLPVTDSRSTLPGKAYPLRCVVYTMKVGAVGLNFSVANKCIFNDMDWNPSLNLQAEFRVHRIDSQHPVEIQYMVLAGTYDEQVFNRVQQKGNLNKATNEIMRKVEKARQDPEATKQLANDYLMSIVDSVLVDLPLSPPEQAHYQKKRNDLEIILQSQVQPRQIAARSWYNNFKNTSLKHRHLW